MADPTVEDKAKEMGWAPQDKWRGEPGKWIDAEAFVRRGEELLPIVRAENRKLRTEAQTQATRLTQQEARLAQQDELLRANAEAIEELKQANSNVNIARAKAAKVQLKKDIAQAKEDEDHAAEVELQDQLDEVNASLRESAAKPREGEKDLTKPPKPNGEPVDWKKDPVMVQWVSENDWFGVNDKLTSFAVWTAQQIQSTKGLVGRPLLDAVKERVEETFPEDFDAEPERQPSKVSGNRPARRSNGDAGPKGKSYADLPQDCKDACERQAKRLVGAGRAYKTNEEWRTAYATKYFEE